MSSSRGRRATDYRIVCTGVGSSPEVVTRDDVNAAIDHAEAGFGLETRSADTLWSSAMRPSIGMTTIPKGANVVFLGTVQGAYGRPRYLVWRRGRIGILGGPEHRLPCHGPDDRRRTGNQRLRRGRPPLRDRSGAEPWLRRRPRAAVHRTVIGAVAESMSHRMAEMRRPSTSQVAAW